MVFIRDEKVSPHFERGLNRATIMCFHNNIIYLVTGKVNRKITNLRIDVYDIPH